MYSFFHSVCYVVCLRGEVVHRVMDYTQNVRFFHPSDYFHIDEDLRVIFCLVSPAGEQCYREFWSRDLEISFFIETEEAW